MNPASFWRPEAAAYICSFPKSGRTWLRFMLAHILVTHYGLPVELDLHTCFTVIPNDEGHPDRGWPAYRFGTQIPCVTASHRAYDQEIHGGRPAVFLLRDPRDVLVSFWLHQTRQFKRFSGDLSSFVRHEEYGIGFLLGYLQSWLDASQGPRTLVTTYEDLHADTPAVLRAVCVFLEIPASEQEISAAAVSGSFQRMQALELRGGIAGLRYDRSDESALRVRRGLVRGYQEQLCAADEMYIRSVIERAAAGVQAMLARTGYQAR
jgi:hypothetical protein